MRDGGIAAEETQQWMAEMAKVCKAKGKERDLPAED